MSNNPNPFDDVFGGSFEPNVADEYKERIRAALEDHVRLNESRAPNPHALKSVSRDEFWQGSEEKKTPKKRDFNDRAKTHLKRMGYWCERVDWYDARFQRAHDLLGMFDLLALGDGETVGVQICARSSTSTRRKKILAEPRHKLVKAAGWKVLLLGFPESGAPTEEWL